MNNQDCNKITTSPENEIGLENKSYFPAQQQIIKAVVNLRNITLAATRKNRR